MPLISHVTDEQRSQIPHYIEKWESKRLLTTPIFRSGFEKGLQDICAEISIEIPQEFLYYPSPAAMWEDFEAWKPKITQVQTQYWYYQIPLCDPSSMHRLWSPGIQRPAFNFAAKRYSPGPKYALCEAQDSDETSGTIIEKTLHRELWNHFEFYGLAQHCSQGHHSPLNGYHAGRLNEDEIASSYLEERLLSQDPSSQIGYIDLCFIGPQLWLLRELACVDFCHSVLGIDRNERLYGGLEALVENGSYCGVFGRLCVACERPYKIEEGGRKFSVTFRDGDVFNYEEEGYSRGFYIP
jgi:hypothetical protein